MIPFPDTFERVLAPITVSDFCAKYYEQKPLFVPHKDAEYFSSIFNLAALWSHIETANASCSGMMFVKLGEKIDEAALWRDERTIDPLGVAQLLRSGATVTLQELHIRSAKVAKLCRNAEQLFNCPFNANAYFTPAKCQGLARHHDTHDVFVLQIAGKKRWHLFEPTLELPLPGQVMGNEAENNPRSLGCFELSAGDVLYIPRGFPHEAIANERDSLHLTLGSHVWTWADFLVEAVAEVAHRDSAFRKGLPIGYTSGQFDADRMKDVLGDLLDRLALNLRPRRVLSRFAETFILSRRQIFESPYEQIERADRVTIDSRVGGHPGLIYSFQRSGPYFHLLCHGRDLTFPEHLAGTVSFALTRPAFTVGDLPGDLSNDAKLCLIQRLIAEGLVQILEYEY
jgi:bifunctional lysine-specific demethylase and histidyl-hydroxylase NO66